MKSIKSIRSHHFALSARPFEIPFFRLAISAASRIPKRSVKQASGCGNVAQISQKSSCPIYDYDYEKSPFQTLFLDFFPKEKQKHLLPLTREPPLCHVLLEASRHWPVDKSIKLWFFHILLTKIVLKQLF